MQERTGAAVILPKDRDPRMITVRRGGTLTDSDYQLLALWAAACAEQVVHLFEAARPSDARTRRAIEQIRHGRAARARWRNPVRRVTMPWRRHARCAGRRERARRATRVPMAA